jgi:hypothetical protein
MADWLDALFSGVQERGQEAEPAPPRRGAKPLVQFVWIQTRPPANGDLGGCQAGHYFVENGEVVMCDEDGKPTGLREVVTVGGDPRAVASRLTKRAWLAEQGPSGRFNRPLSYGRLGNA